ncbi:MAG: DUF4905 domain-containing protein [Bacteroidia bacterium]|nr:DUF4905 domain-containing protein [Bacteroidia bacterium]
MKLFSKNNTLTPRPLWEFDAGTVLWRIKPDNAGHFLGEARDPEARICTFFCIDEHTGAPLWQGLRFEESWWIGIEDAIDGRIFFHGFGKPDMPQHLGIIACSIDTAEVLWRETELAFLFYHEGHVYAAEQRFDTLHFHQLDAATGARVRDLGDDPAPLNRLRAQLNEEEWFSGYAYPEQFTPGHTEWQQVLDRTQALFDTAAIVGTVDILDRGDVRYVAWHEKLTAGGLAQRFAVLDADGRQLMRDTILDYADAPGMDSFFVKDHQLLYVRNRSVLVAHPVAGRGK